VDDDCCLFILWCCLQVDDGEAASSLDCAQGQVGSRDDLQAGAQADGHILQYSTQQAGYWVVEGCV
jgi:hypothetical protein